MIFLNFLCFCCYVSLFISDFINLDTSLCPLCSLAKSLFILLIFSKNQLLLWLILCIVLFVGLFVLICLFVFTWLISALSLIISCCLLLLGEFVSFCSRAFICAVKLLVCALSSFTLEALRPMGFPLRTAFIVSH